MRFCPFCSAENADELQVCAQCGRRLPPAPARRRNAPPTGIQLPTRPARPTGAQPPQPPAASNFSQPVVAAPQPISPSSQYSVQVSPQTAPIAIKSAPDRESSPVLPPPPTTPNPVVPGSSPTVRASPAALAAPTSTVTTIGPGSSPTVTAVGPGSSPTVATSLGSSPTNPVVVPTAATRGPATAHDRQALLDAISPPPAAQRRPAPPPEPERQAGAPTRRKSDFAPLPAAAGAGAADDFNTVVGGEPIDLDDPRLLDAPTGILQADPPTSVTTTAIAPAPPPARPKTSSIPPAIPASGPRPIPSLSRPNSPSQPPPTGSAPRPITVPPPLTSSGPRPSVPPPLSSTRPGTASVPPPLARATSVGVPAAPQVGIPPARPSAAELVAIGEPPPTRIQRPDALVDRPFTPPKVHPIPTKPEPGLVPAARYAVRFARARYQRRGAIKLLAIEIKQDTESLDQVLGLLGKVARDNRIEGRVFSAENAAITAAEERTAQLHRDSADVDARKADENTRFVAIEGERNAKLADADRAASEAQRDVTYHEGRRRSLRDQKKDLERRQKAYLKAAEDADRQSSSSQMGDARADLRRSAEQHRKEAAALEPERQDLDRQLAALEKPAADAIAKLESAKAELDAAKRSLADAREGHTHRLDELDAEQKRKTREMGQADSEIQRRLVTLGTLVNLNRTDDPVYGELYQRIDRLRTAITSRTTESERLAAEREAYDRGALVRGVSVIGGAIVLFIAFIVILRACI